MSLAPAQMVVLVLLLFFFVVETQIIHLANLNKQGDRERIKVTYLPESGGEIGHL